MKFILLNNKLLYIEPIQQSVDNVCSIALKPDGVKLIDRQQIRNLPAFNLANAVFFVDTGDNYQNGFLNISPQGVIKINGEQKLYFIVNDGKISITTQNQGAKYSLNIITEDLCNVPRPVANPIIMNVIINPTILSFYQCFVDTDKQIFQIDPVNYSSNVAMIYARGALYPWLMDDRVTQILKRKAGMYNFLHYQMVFPMDINIYYNIEQMSYVGRVNLKTKRLNASVLFMYYLNIDSNYTTGYQTIISENNDMWNFLPLDIIQFQHAKIDIGNGVQIITNPGPLNNTEQFSVNVFCIWLLYYLNMIEEVYRGQYVYVPYLVNKPELLFERMFPYVSPDNVEQTTVPLIYYYLQTISYFYKQNPSTTLRFYHNSQYSLWTVIQTYLTGFDLTAIFIPPTGKEIRIYEEGQNQGFVVMLDHRHMRDNDILTNYNRSPNLLQLYNLHRPADQNIELQIRPLSFRQN
jgi:hypothetical protein